MTEPNTGSSSDGTEAQPIEAGTAEPKDELTLLRSRNAGLDAKVSKLLEAQAAAEARAAAAEKRALELAEAKDGGDAELRAELAKAREAAAAAEQKAALADIKTAYPETFSVLGDAALKMTADQLAAAETRFRGVAENDQPETPTPVGNSPARPVSPGSKALEDMSVDELWKEVARQAPLHGMVRTE